MSLLSRVANHFYWFGRYVERAENTARLIIAYANLALDLPRSSRLEWYSLVETTGSDAAFHKAAHKPTELGVMRFLIEDRENPGSIVSSLRFARENLRSTRDRGVALACAAAFTSRGVLAVTGAFMSLWLVQYGTGTLGMSGSDAMGKLAMPRVLVIVTGALIGSILMGLLADRIRRVTAVAIASAFTAVIYGSLFLVDDPTAPWVFALLGLMGIAEISAFVASQALVGQQAPAALRGVIIGFFGVAGAIGILIGTSVGGFLFRDIGPSAPFIMFSAFNALVFLWAMAQRRQPDHLPNAAAQGAPA